MNSTVALVVECRREGTGWRCVVTVGTDARATTHDVAVSGADLARYAPGAAEPSVLVDASFRFLLQREPREAILRRFDLPVIEGYFPDYATEIAGRAT